MKKVYVIFIFLFSFGKSFSQKIAQSEIDKFTKEKRVSTDFANLHMGLMNFLRIKIRSVDTTCFMTFNGTIGAGVVGTKDPTIFLFDDSTTTSIYPTSVQTYDIGIGNNLDSYSQQYYITKSQIIQLSTKKITSIRRYYSSYYRDIDLKTKFSKNAQELATVFLAEVNK